MPKVKHKQISARRVVITSFIVDLSDVALNLTTAILSGSVVVLTEALQGVADLLTSGLLWIGVHRSKRRADVAHRFGFGKELFFWILMAGVSMFVLTAGFSFYFGLRRFMNPEPIHNLWLAYLALGIGTITNGYAFSLSMRRLGIRIRDTIGRSLRRIGNSTLIETKATAILDSMGATASVLGLISLILYGITGDGRLDGVGAMVVGLCCGIFAILLILEVKDFIVGRSAPQEMEDQIRKVAEKVKGVNKVLDLMTMQMGSEKVMVNMEVHLDRNLTTEDIEVLMDELKAIVKYEVPAVQHIQVEVETPRGMKAIRKPS